MTDEARQQAEIAGNEQWLAGACEPAEPIDTSRIKQRVRIEIGERWLDGQMSGEAPSGLAARVRGQTRRAVLEAQAGDTGDDRALRRGRRVLISIGVVVGMAAALVIAWIGLGPSEIVPGEADAELPLADAFERFESDDFDLSLSELRDDLTQVATGSLDGSLDDTLDELFEDEAEEDGGSTNDTTIGPVGMSRRPTELGA